MNSQSTYIRLTIPVPAKNIPTMDLLFLGLSVVEKVKSSGGKARCIRTHDAIVVEQSGTERSLLDNFVKDMSALSADDFGNLTPTIVRREKTEIDLETEGIIPGEYARLKFTKTLLFSLPAGAIVVGNSIVGGKPNFATRLDPGRDRSRIWREAIRCYANQRICAILWNTKDVSEIHEIDIDTWVNRIDRKDPSLIFRK